MKWLIENWCSIVVAVSAIIIVVRFCITFSNKPTEEQIDQVKEWLLYAVVIAEQNLGSGTGQLKLRQVYDMFLTKFSWLAQVISFSTFSLWVDEALEQMKHLLESNAVVKHIVDGTGDYIVEIDKKEVLKND